MQANYGYGVSRASIQQVLDSTPQTPQFAATRDALQQLIIGDTVRAEPFTYNIVYRAAAGGNAIAAAALNQIGSFTVQADADFLILAQSYDVNTANASTTFNTRPQPNLSVVLTNTGANYAYMDQAMPVPNIFGLGWDTFELPEAIFLAAKATMQSNVSNFDPATAFNLVLSFHGVKLFKS
jgi:hypothetical protein